MVPTPPLVLVLNENIDEERRENNVIHMYNIKKNKIYIIPVLFIIILNDTNLNKIKQIQ